MKTWQYRFSLVGLRISLGFLFLWAFFDKFFGLGFATAPAKAWLRGGSPTFGFLSNSTGPFAGIYAAIAGHPFIDWLFMMALFFIGLSLCLGVAMKLATKSGALLVLLMWSASLLPKNNPILDDHIVYFFGLLLLGATEAGSGWWTQTKISKRFSWLQ